MTDFIYSVNYALRSMCYGLKSIVKSGIYSVISFCFNNSFNLHKPSLQSSVLSLIRYI